MMTRQSENVEQGLLDLIERGDYSEDGRFISDREAMARFGVSRSTVRKAISNLVLQGYLYRIQGKGTFVRTRSGNQPLFSITDSAATLESAGYSVNRRVVFKETERASAPVAELLRVNPGDRVLHLGVLITADRIPANYTVYYVPLAKFSKLEQVDFKETRVTDAFERIYHVRTRYWQHSVQSVLVPPEIAGILQIPRNAPVLMFDTVTWASLDRIDFPIEYYHCYCKPEFSRFDYTQKNVSPLYPNAR